MKVIVLEIVSWFFQLVVVGENTYNGGRGIGNTNKGENTYNGGRGIGNTNKGERVLRLICLKL
jgi:hypothetical protein